MRYAWRASLAFVVLLGCSRDPHAPDAATVPVPAAPPAIAAPAAPPPVGGPAAPQLPPHAAPQPLSPAAAPGATSAAPSIPPPVAPLVDCERYASKRMLDAITGLDTRLVAMPEPAIPAKRIVRCEHRARDVEEHFGFYLECGRRARKLYARLWKQMKKMGRKRRGAWRGGFDAPGTFVFLSEDRRCVGQVAGRLLLRRPDVGERVAFEVARHLRGAY